MMHENRLRDHTMRIKTNGVVAKSDTILKQHTFSKYKQDDCYHMTCTA